jgi:hypothetical protein
MLSPVVRVASTYPRQTTLKPHLQFSARLISTNAPKKTVMLSYYNTAKGNLDMLVQDMNSSPTSYPTHGLIIKEQTHPPTKTNARRSRPHLDLQPIKRYGKSLV